MDREVRKVATALLVHYFEDLKELGEALKRVEELRQRGIEIDVSIVSEQEKHKLTLVFDKKYKDEILKAIPQAVVLGGVE